MTPSSSLTPHCPCDGPRTIVQVRVDDVTSGWTTNEARLGSHPAIPCPGGMWVHATDPTPSEDVVSARIERCDACGRLHGDLTHFAQHVIEALPREGTFEVHDLDADQPARASDEELERPLSGVDLTLVTGPSLEAFASWSEEVASLSDDDREAQLQEWFEEAGEDQVLASLWTFDGHRWWAERTQVERAFALLGIDPDVLPWAAA